MLARGVRWLRPLERYWALFDVSFSVPPGRMVGVVGGNGAGKSTLLRLLGGVSQPDTGELIVRGRIGALLDLGAGFHPDLTGRENVYVSGVIGGLTRREVARRFDEIVAFAELEQTIDDPLRTYSSGMQMRLAFAVATHIEPELLLIDEVLAVGDLAFQRKCLDRILHFRNQGCTIMLVTHDPQLVQRFCDDALWLRSGRLIAYGRPDVVVGQYVAEMSAAERVETSIFSPVQRMPSGCELKINENRFGSQEVEITHVRLLDWSGQEMAHIASGERLFVEVHYRADMPIRAPIFYCGITTEEGSVCFETNSGAAGVTLPVVQGEDVLTLQIDRLDLAAGKYFVDIGVYEQAWAYAYDFHWHVYPFLVASPFAGKGLLRPPHQWHTTTTPAISISLPLLDHAPKHVSR
jgi:lipopolysaccharide transport system ATP-binding protein